jgi:WD40 repeat protein
MEFFRDLVLRTTSTAIVIFFDEIDSTINLSFSDDFFAAIRACYNARATEPEYRRLSFVLLGVASPSQLIKDPKRTPFNIGYRVELTDFTREEAEPLAQGLNSDTIRSSGLLERILYWTGGHPYLTQKLCKLVSEDTVHADPEMTVDRLVEKEFLAQEASQNEINFQRVRELTAGSPESRQLLRLYLRIYRGQQVLDDPLSPIQTGLKLSGLAVVREGRVLSVRNRIYARVFSEEWAKSVMPRDWNRRVAVASVALLIVGFGVWYTQFLPRPYIVALQNASEDYPASTYAELHKIPGYASKADELLAEYWDRRAIKFAATGDRDQALFARLQGLTAQDSDIRRREANLLVGPDYEDLISTFRHGASVTAVAFSPDGKLALTGSDDRTARLWRTDTGVPVSPPLRHEDWVKVVAFSQDGKLALTGSRDGTARLWRTDAGQPVAQPIRHKYAQVVTFSPDGKLALTGSVDDTARLWRTDTGAPVGQPLRHKNSVKAVAFSPDGKLALTGSRDHTARLWRVDTGAPIGSPLQHDGKVWAVAFSPDGKLVLTSSGEGTARLWRTDTGAAVGPPLRHERRLSAITFSPDGTLVLTGSSDSTARLWRTDTGAPFGQPLLHEDNVTAVAFSPDGTLVLSGSDDRTARLWRTDTGASVGPPLRHEASVTAVAFSPDGRFALSGSSDGTARVWHINSGVPVDQLLRHEDIVSDVALSRDGKLVLTSSADGTVRLWRTDNGAMAWQLRVESGVNNVAFSPDGKLALTGSNNGMARLWRTDTGAPVGSPLRHDENSVWAVAFSPDGTLALTGSLDRTARLWRTDTGAPVGQPLRHENAVWAVAFSPYGKLALTGSDDRTARLWRTDTGAPVGQPLRHESTVWAVAFSPDGTLALTGSDDGTASLWRTDSGEPVGKPLRHESSVTAVAFSPDGKNVLVSTQWWVHFHSISQEQMTPIASRLLAGTWIGGYRWLNDSGGSLQVAIRSTADSIRIESLRLDATEAEPITGKPDILAEEWQRKLALKF